MLLIIVSAEKRRERKMTKGRRGGIFSIKLEICNYSLKHDFFFSMNSIQIKVRTQLSKAALETLRAD